MAVIFAAAARAATRKKPGLRRAIRIQQGLKSAAAPAFVDAIGLWCLPVV